MIRVCSHGDDGRTSEEEDVTAAVREREEDHFEDRRNVTVFNPEKLQNRIVSFIYVKLLMWDHLYYCSLVFKKACGIFFFSISIFMFNFFYFYWSCCHCFCH
ncbi:unnamed protein product [Vicia faba]|uniref:Uncharacterized protein n=1 Tax=Vicia faba TaxID=3906 RepID=A0AAV0ZTG8_VICFA|nr:unnamed protein product [Vicia faba]